MKESVLKLQMQAQMKAQMKTQMKTQSPGSPKRRAPAAGICAVALALLLGGCASGPGGGSIYVPAGGGDRVPEQEPRTPQGSPPSTAPGEQERLPSSESQSQPQSQPRVEEPRAPTHRTESQSLSPAAASLVQQADQSFRAGNINGGLALLQRAQRISPDAAAIYFKMAEGYVLSDNLPRAEQFAMKGISVAGSNQALQKSGWQLLADIRQARGNVAGARNAEDKAATL